MVEMLSHKMRKLPAPTKKIKGTKMDQFTPLADHIAVSNTKTMSLFLVLCDIWMHTLLIKCIVH